MWVKNRDKETMKTVGQEERRVSTASSQMAQSAAFREPPSLLHVRFHVRWDPTVTHWLVLQSGELTGVKATAGLEWVCLASKIFTQVPSLPHHRILISFETLLFPPLLVMFFWPTPISGQGQMKHGTGQLHCFPPFLDLCECHTQQQAKKKKKWHTNIPTTPLFCSY